jgi:Asp-tRNA(Asn)/Glu-tRNA(Gln) amidotransferase A subunit family amidase
MVPLATGSQNNGSVIRPASYCGVYGYKPTFGRISRHGALRQSPSLDQIGVFGRTIEDVALLAQELMVFDPQDRAMRPVARPRLLAATSQDPPVEPRLGFVKTSVWNQASESTQQAFVRLVAQLGPRVTEATLPPHFETAHTVHRIVMEPELAVSYGDAYSTGKDRLSPTLREIIKRGQGIPATEYLRALEQIPPLAAALDGVLSRYDAVLTPATPREAPLGRHSTGSPIFCTIWTLCGVPAISIPILTGANNMPLGVQLVAARGDDARLLRTARWLANVARRS